MITIILVLIVFLCYVYIIRRQEGLINQYLPISVENNKRDEIFNRIKDPKDPFYQPKFINFLDEDVKMDMEYFNNTTDLLLRLDPSIGK